MLSFFSRCRRYILPVSPFSSVLLLFSLCATAPLRPFPPTLSNVSFDRIRGGKRMLMFCCSLRRPRFPLFFEPSALAVSCFLALMCLQSDLCDPHHPVSVAVILNRMRVIHLAIDYLLGFFFFKSPLDVASDSLKVANMMNESLTGVVYIEESQLDATFLALRFFFSGVAFSKLNVPFFSLFFFSEMLF